MRIKSKYQPGRAGFLQLDLLMGLAVFAIAVMPVGYSFVRERETLRIEYFRTVINEIVDGEMEILAAGAARNLPDGAQNLPVSSPATGLLPPGHFQLTKTGNHLKVEWTPDGKCGLSAIARETTLK